MGSKGWSAPLFFTVRGVGMGLTFGAALLESVILLNSEDAVNGFTKDEVGLQSVGT
jgi:lipid-binding SYLF domain-containing protein